MGNPEDRELLDEDLLRSKPKHGEKLREILFKRSDILQAVANEPLTKPELIDIVGVSRSTIDRGIRSLESVDCVETKDGHYTTTTKGEFALSEYMRYKTNTDGIHDGGDILNYLSKDVEINGDFLCGMAVHSGTQHVPDSVLEYSNKLMESTDRMIGLAPVALTSYPSQIEDEIKKRNMRVELVIENAVFDSLRDLKGDVITSLSESDNVDLYIHENSLPYAVWVMEHENSTTAGITVYGDGAVQGILTNDSPEAVEWAKQMYRKYREQAVDICKNT